MAVNVLKQLLCHLAYLTVDSGDKESESDGDDVDDRDLDDEAGDLGNEDCDKLDEQMWGSDSEDPIQVMLAAVSVECYSWPFCQCVLFIPATGMPSFCLSVRSFVCAQANLTRKPSCG